MRNSYKYNIDSIEYFYNLLLSKSIETKYISILLSNQQKSSSSYPVKYIDYDLIAGYGMIKEIKSNKDSLENLRRFHDTNKDWLFGYMSYELKNEIEGLTSSHDNYMSTDNISFFIPKYVFLLKDNKLEVLTYKNKLYMDAWINNYNIKKINLTRPISLIPNETKDDYLSKIRAIKKHIQKGDIYELNYCMEYYAEDVLINPELIFKRLNNINRNPFSVFLHINNHYALCASPERFLKKDGCLVISQPIKGTIKRGVDKAEDEILVSKLKNSQKDISENVMITDLVRNDLSITATKASVKVSDFCNVYTFDRIHQMISTISSNTHKDCHFTKVLETTFPMGSMTGAPKIKAMELIDKYEKFNRGMFSGTIGYIKPEGDFDFNVVIRSILYNSEKKYVSVGVGGAITIKSDEYSEYEECLLKIEPILEALIT